MKKALVVLVSVLLAASFAATAFCADEPEKFGPNVGDKLKPFALTDPTSSKQFTLKDLSANGQDTAIVFMQTACSLCLSEIVEIVGAADDLNGKLNIALISLDFQVDRIAPYKNSYKIPFPILHDKEAAVLESLNISSTPATVVVDGKGVIKKKTVGYSKADLKGMIKEYSK